jgi:LysR family transcriptional activator of glutamate synthase operon
MTIENFKEFIVLANAGNFLEAAESLFVSQATLSRHIIQMEKELGTHLFNRLPRKVELSGSGILFMPFARRIAGIDEACQADFAKKLRGVNSVLTIGSLRNISEYEIMDLLTSFRAQHPYIGTRVIEASSENLLQLLHEDSCDFAFVKESGRQGTDEFSRLQLCTDTFVAVLPCGHPLAKAGAVRLEQLRNETFLLPPEESMSYKVCIDSCRRAGFEPNLISWGLSGRNIFHLFGSGKYISFLSKRPYISQRNSNAIMVDITPTIHASINLIYKKGSLSTAGERFVSFVQSYLKRTCGEAVEASGDMVL